MKETSITDYDVFKGACWIQRGGPGGGVGGGGGKGVQAAEPCQEELSRRSEAGEVRLLGIW